MADLPLSVAAYDRVADRRTDEAWLADAWSRARIVAISRRSSAPTARGGDGAPHLVYREPDDAGDGPRRFLGVVGDQPYFAVTTEPDDRDDWLTLREIGGRADDLEAGLLTAAIALEQWHLRHPRCPQCGEPTTEHKAGWTRVCSNDGSEHFPRMDPAVIMLIHDGADHALLGRGHQWNEGRFSTLAGFVEPGESLEAAVAREVLEETNVGVRDIRYVASQPWPFPASLMLGFTAVLDGDPSVQIDPVEMAEAAWFSRDEIAAARDWTDEHEPATSGSRLQAIPPRFSISRYLIDRWLQGDA
ncbi:MAG: NAD(+) diphosphatase [Jatrophihabitans sp.]|uniref:NAD(+) diphosphatase n=1 Tax=Jatrophihabitans sp. TaxID=1932789 RepID=UPI003F7F444D